MNNDNKHIDPTDLIAKYLSGEASPEEIRWLENWVLEDDANKKLFNEYRQTWALTNQPDKNSNIDLDAELSKLESRIFSSDDNSSRVIVLSDKKKTFHVFRIAAAVLVLVSLSFVLYFLFSGSKMEQFVSLEEVEVKTLPDGSNVTLNHHSTLSYSINESKNKRLVKLEGEAFFKVHPNASKPFVIETGKVEVEVLGTSFSVNSREENATIEVVVESGKVAFKGINNQVVLTKGQKGIFEKRTGELRKELNNDVNYDSWKTNRLIFENTMLVEVFDRIANTYHVSIKISNLQINSCRVTATFEQQSLDAVHAILEETLDLRIEKQDSGYTVSGKGCLDSQ